MSVAGVDASVARTRRRSRAGSGLSSRGAILLVVPALLPIMVFSAIPLIRGISPRRRFGPRPLLRARPVADEVVAARELLARFAAAERAQVGAIALADGAFVDAALVRSARQTVAHAARYGVRPT